MEDHIKWNHSILRKLIAEGCFRFVLMFAVGLGYWCHSSWILFLSLTQQQCSIRLYGLRIFFLPHLRCFAACSCFLCTRLERNYRREWNPPGHLKPMSSREV